MHTGMLWFDNSQTSLAAKVRKAASYYKKKYSRDAEMCLVHPSMLGDQSPEDVDGITIRAYRPVLPGHLWIGVEELPEYAREQKAFEEHLRQKEVATQMSFVEVTS